MPATKTPTKLADESAAPERVSHPSLAVALAAFQAEVPTIRKGNTASVRSDKGNYTYDYADLSDVTEKALPLLGKHGLAFVTRPTIEDNVYALRYLLMHESNLPDDEIAGVYPLPAPTNPQAMGSAITYARRYVLCAVTGIAPGGDDDDASLAQYGQQQRPAQGSAPAGRPAQQRQQSPARDFAAEAHAAEGDHIALSALWQEARAARQPVEVLDVIAALGRAAAPAEDATEPAPEAAAESAGESDAPVGEAEAQVAADLNEVPK